MAIETFDTGSAFTIAEVEGDGVVVVLVDRALPYRPFELTTKGRVEITWYPGNPQATSTVLGSAEDPTRMNGYWKDKYLGQAVSGDGIWPFTVNDLVIQTVREAADVIDDLVRRCALVEVTWDQQIRQGHIDSFVKRWHNTHDLEWEMSFVWISRGEPTAPAVVSPDTSVSETAATIEKKAKQLNEAAIPPFETTADFQTAVTEMLSALLLSVQGVQGAVSNLATNKIGPFDASRRTIATCTSIISQTDDIISYFDEQVSGAFNAAVALADQTFGQRLVADAYVQDVLLAARELRRIAISRRVALGSFIVEDILGTYRAREGDNLRDVSQLFYKTANEWRRLLLFNELFSAELTNGQVVLVPKITTGGRQ